MPNPEIEQATVEDDDEVRQVNPFVVMDAGFATIDPTDPNKVIFEDFRPRIVPSETPQEEFELEIPTAPKDLSAPAPAFSSESTQTTEPTKSEKPAQPESESQAPTVTEPTLPAPPLGPLPFPSSKDADTDDGKRSQSASG